MVRCYVGGVWKMVLFWHKKIRFWHFDFIPSTGGLSLTKTEVRDDIRFWHFDFIPSTARFLPTIVRPTKKPTNLSLSGEVPKVGCGRNFWKKVFPWKGGVEGWEGCYGLTFFSFPYFCLLSCTLKWGDLFLKKFWCPLQKRGLKNQRPSLFDHFDRWFSHTTGEGLQLWFWSLLDIF